MIVHQIAEKYKILNLLPINIVIIFNNASKSQAPGRGIQIGRQNFLLLMLKDFHLYGSKVPWE